MHPPVALVRRYLRLQWLAKRAQGDRLQTILARLSDARAHIRFIQEFGVI